MEKEDMALLYEWTERTFDEIDEKYLRIVIGAGFTCLRCFRKSEYGSDVRKHDCA